MSDRPAEVIYVKYLAGSMEGQEVSGLPPDARKQDGITICDVCYADRDVWTDPENNIYYGPHEHQWPSVAEADAAYKKATRTR